MGDAAAEGIGNCGHGVRGSFKECFYHLGWSEAEFLAAHAAEKATNGEKSEACAFGLAQQGSEALAFDAVVESAGSEGILRLGASFGRWGSFHQAGWRSGCLRQRYI